MVQCGLFFGNKKTVKVKHQRNNLNGRCTLYRLIEYSNFIILCSSSRSEVTDDIFIDCQHNINVLSIE